MNYTLNLPPNYIKPKLPGRDKWTAELRSGRHTQGKGMLQCDDGSRCCLGVLCHLQGRLGLYETLRGAGLLESNPLFHCLCGEGKLPSTVSVIVTKEYDNGDKMDYTWYTLANCNDAGLTFLQIADIIEAVWENED